MTTKQQLHKYWIIAMISAKEHVSYRANYLTEVFGMLLWTGFTMITWWSLYDINNVSEINGYDRQTMMVYLFGVGVIVSSIHLLRQGDKAVEDIHQGVLNTYLMKPLHPTLYWLTYDISRKILTCAAVIGTSAIAGMIASYWIHWLPSWKILLPTVLFIAIGMLINFFLFHIVSLLSFWVGVSWGYSFVLRVTMILATGGLIPLDLLPPHLKAIFLYAPFQFFGYIPLQSLLGRLTNAQVLIGATQGIGWIIACAFVGHLVYRRGLKTYGAYGG